MTTGEDAFTFATSPPAPPPRPSPATTVRLPFICVLTVTDEFDTEPPVAIAALPVPASPPRRVTFPVTVAFTFTLESEAPLPAVLPLPPAPPLTSTLPA